MAIYTQVFTAGDYTAKVTDDNYVEIEYQTNIINRPGPWGDQAGAVAWAELIVAKYAVDGH